VCRQVTAADGYRVEDAGKTTKSTGIIVGSAMCLNCRIERERERIGGYDSTGAGEGCGAWGVSSPMIAML